MSGDDQNIKPPQPVTQRFSDVSITERMPSGHITERMDGPQPVPEMPAHEISLHAEDLVDDQFRVMRGPVGELTGEAEVYICRDEQTNQPVALKLYRYHMTPKKHVLERLLNLGHPDIITLKKFGVWTGRFYEVMEYCEGGSLADYMPFPEDVLTDYLHEILEGLNYCHNMQIVHRDVKPNNIFYRDKDRTDVVIGDFGISSILDTDEKVRKTQSYKNLTLDYAAPELLSKEEVSPKTDYYALGISLIHLMTGISPFKHIGNPTAILAAHLTGKIDYPKEASEKFKKLLQGLLQIRSENRWGYRQIRNWMSGEPILNDNGTVWKEEIFGGLEVPFPGFPEIKTPKEMAISLNLFESKYHLFRGNIYRWVFDHFDSGMADKIREIEENYGNNQDLGLMKLQYLLDPTLPFNIAGHPIQSLDDVVELLLNDTLIPRQKMQIALYGGFIESWVDAVFPREIVSMLVPQIKDIRERIVDKELGLFALKYILDPSLPLELIPGVIMKHPEEIEKILEEHPEAESPLRYMLDEGYIEEWLQAVYPGRAADVEFIAKTKVEYAEKLDLLFMVIRWHFKTDMPFLFGDEYAKTPEELAMLIDRNNRFTQLGIDYLKNGWLRAWLISTGRMPDPKPYDDVINDPSSNWDIKMEHILHVLDPILAWPIVAAKPMEFDAGMVPIQSTRQVKIELYNSGRGYLYGIIYLENMSKGMSFDETILDRGPTVVNVLINPLGLPLNSMQDTNLIVESNGGTLKIPIKYKVTAPLEKMILSSIYAGAAFGFIVGFLRFLIGLVNVTYKAQAADWYHMAELNSRREDPLFTFLVSLLVMAIFFGVYYLVRVLIRIHELESERKE